MQFNDLGKQWETIREVVLEKIDKLGLSRFIHQWTSSIRI